MNKAFPGTNYLFTITHTIPMGSIHHFPSIILQYLSYILVALKIRKRV